MNKRKSIIRQTTESGFTLLIAALIASIVLSLASAIFSIAKKQVALSSLSQQSQYAFYASDTAAECALYWDVRFGYFAPVTPVLPAPFTVPVCDTQPLVVTNTNPGTYPYMMSFEFEPNGVCAKVTIQKCQGTISEAGVCTFNGATVSTKIHVDGFNTSCATISTNPIALERSVEVDY